MRRELKHKIAYLKLGPTDNIEIYMILTKNFHSSNLTLTQEKVPELYIAGTTIAVS